LLLSFLAEFGELAEEIKIKYMNKSTKVPGPDGVAGELVDVFICLYAYAKATSAHFQYRHALLQYSPPMQNLKWFNAFLACYIPDDINLYNTGLALLYNAYSYENSTDMSFEQYMSTKLDKWESKLK